MQRRSPCHASQPRAMCGDARCSTRASIAAGACAASLGAGGCAPQRAEGSSDWCRRGEGGAANAALSVDGRWLRFQAVASSQQCGRREGQRERLATGVAAPHPARASERCEIEPSGAAHRHHQRVNHSVRGRGCGPVVVALQLVELAPAGNPIHVPSVLEGGGRFGSGK